MKWPQRGLRHLSGWPARAVWALAAAWAGVVYWASSRAGDEIPVFAFPHMDKVLHFGVFAVGGALVTWALCRWPMRLKRAALLGVILVAFTVRRMNGTSFPPRAVAGRTFTTGWPTSPGP